MKGPLIFPAPGNATRNGLGTGRWQGFYVRFDENFVGAGALELPVCGRRVVVHQQVLNPLMTVFNVVAGAQEVGILNPDQNARVILWFNAVGRESFVTPPVPGAISYWRLDGSGVYIPFSTPVDYTVTFQRLFFEVPAFAGGFNGVNLQFNVEQFTKPEGDQS